MATPELQTAVARRPAGRSFNWVELQKRLPQRMYWRRWNLEYTKRLLASDPYSENALLVLRCWPQRVQRALRYRYGIA